MGKYDDRDSFETVGSLRGTCVDDSCAIYCDFVLPVNPCRKIHRSEREKHQSSVGTTESTEHTHRENVNSLGAFVQQNAERKAVKSRGNNIFSRLLKIFIPHRIKLETAKSKIDLDEIELKLDQMIASLNGDDHWFVECHTKTEDKTEKDE